MPWWSWVLIWTGLVLGLLAMLAWFGFALFKKVRGTVRALQELGDLVSDVTGGQEAPAPDRFRPAIFTDLADLYFALELVQRDRGQRRQRRRDSLIARGKLVTTRPLTQRTDTDA
ncbi:hypothetical protein E3T28_08710 [Cryobacterium sinapicolor]|uniref:Uncharacterized protein n=1 Tax=Cryobacterium sinapicolor TaxID=1259236 RepID=A0ABY2J511_9MICO|nr:hypothetical protein [Cryobacterium sinapicolor]TFD00030.1 hypothetical protein E3T28_08710 [Cryobacterium sinapicolor]